MKWFKWIFRTVGALIILGLFVVFSPLLFNTRPLTTEERAVLQPIFEESLNYDVIRVKFGGPLTWTNRGVVIGNTISLHPVFKDPESSDIQYPTLVHEAVHVWQYQNFGLGYIPGSLWQQWTWENAYDISEAHASIKFREYGIEQQAELIEAHYLYPDNELFHPYVEEVRNVQN